MSQKTRTFGYLTSAVVTAPIVAFGKSAITAAKDYEFAMAKIEGLAGIPETLVKEWNDAISKDELDAKVKTLTETSHKLAEAMYKKEQGGCESGSCGTDSKKKKDDDIIDADVE
jgi:hypothetical protein